MGVLITDQKQIVNLEKRVSILEKQMSVLVVLERGNPVKICPSCEKIDSESCLVCCGLGWVPREH